MSNYRQFGGAQAEERRRAGRAPTPARITMALDLADLHGPAVDAALGVAEPTVDWWETGQVRPSPEQVQALAALTGMTVAWFYLPAQEPVRGWLCRRGGCERIDTRPPAPVVALHRDTLW